MTTDTTINADTVLADLQKTRAVMLDPMDMPGDWTPRQRAAYETRRATLDANIIGMRNTSALLVDPTARRDTLARDRDRLRVVQAAIEQQIKEAPDSRLIVDAREREKEWARQQALSASLTALQRGVEYFNGHPAIPSPLRALLTDTCATCGHASFEWPGPLSFLDQEIATLDKTLSELQGRLESCLKSAATLLAEPVPV